MNEVNYISPEIQAKVQEILTDEAAIFDSGITRNEIIRLLYEEYLYWSDRETEFAPFAVGPIVNVLVKIALTGPQPEAQPKVAHRVWAAFNSVSCLKAGSIEIRDDLLNYHKEVEAALIWALDQTSPCNLELPIPKQRTRKHES